MGTTINHIQMGTVEKNGNINIMYPQNTAEDVSIKTTKNIPNGVNNAQDLINNLGLLAFKNDANNLVSIDSTDETERKTENIYLTRYKTGNYCGMFDNTKDYDKGDIVFVKNISNDENVDYLTLFNNNNIIKNNNINSSNGFSSSTLLENGYLPNEAFDLSTDSQWASKTPPDDSEYIGINLGKEYLIEEFAIAWIENFNANKVTVEISDDNIDYNEIETFINKPFYTNKATLYILSNPVTTQYIRFRFENPTTNEVGYRCSEIALFNNRSTYYKFNTNFIGTGTEDITDFSDIYDVNTNDIDFNLSRIVYKLEDHKKNDLLYTYFEDMFNKLTDINKFVYYEDSNQ